MRITDRQLRSIIKEELGRVSLNEAAVSTGKNTNQWLKDTGLQARGAGYTAAYKDSEYFVLDDPARGPGNWTGRSFGDPFTYDDLGGDKLKVVSGPVKRSIGAIISKSGYKGGGGTPPAPSPTDPNAPKKGGGGTTPTPSPTGGDQLPGCSLASMQAPLTQQLTSVLKAGTAVTFYVELILTGRLPSGLSASAFADAGKKISTMGEKGIFAARSVSDLMAGVGDIVAGPANEFVGSIMTYLGTLAGGLQTAMAGFVNGPQKCSFRAFAAAVAKACSDAWSAASAAFNAGFATVAQYWNMAKAAIAKAISTIGGAIASAAAVIMGIIGAFVAGGAALLSGLGAAIQRAIIAVGDAMIATGTGLKQAAGAGAGTRTGKTVPEGRARRALDNLALEICSIHHARAVLQENVRFENRAHVLL